MRSCEVDVRGVNITSGNTLTLSMTMTMTLVPVPVNLDGRGGETRVQTPRAEERDTGRARTGPRGWEPRTVGLGKGRAVAGSQVEAEPRAGEGGEGRERGRGTGAEEEDNGRAVAGSRVVVERVVVWGEAEEARRWGMTPEGVRGLALGVRELGAVAEEVVEPRVEDGEEEEGEPFADWLEGARIRRAGRERRVKERRRKEKETRRRFPESVAGLAARMGMDEAMVRLAFVMEDVLIPGKPFGKDGEVRVLPLLLQRWMDEGSFEHEDGGERAVEVDMNTLRVVAMEAVAAPRSPVRPAPARIRDPGWGHPEGKEEFPIEDLLWSAAKAEEVRSTWLKRAAADDHHYAKTPGRLCTPKAGWLTVTKDDLRDHVLEGRADDPERWPHFDISDPDRCKVRDVSDRKVGGLNTDYLRAILGSKLVDEESLFLADYGWRVNSNNRAYCLTAHGIAKTGTPYYEVRRGRTYYQCRCCSTINITITVTMHALSGHTGTNAERC